MTGVKSGFAAAIAARRSISPGGRSASGARTSATRGAIRHRVQLGAVGAVGHDQLGAAGLQALLDRAGAEGGEQRLIDRSQTPGAEDHRDQLDPARQQPRDHIARPHALGLKQVRGPGREGAQILEAVVCQHLIGGQAAQRDPALAAMAVAAFDAGVDRGVEIAGEGAFLGLQIETRPGRAVIGSRRGSKRI